MLFFILLNIIMLFFCLFFYYNNKKLREIIIELEEENKTILERKIISNKDDLISIEDISIAQESDQTKEKDIPKKEVLTEGKEQSNHLPDLDSLTFINQEKKYTARTNEEETIIPDIKDPLTIIEPINLNKQITPPKKTLEQIDKAPTTPLEKQSSTLSMTIDFDPSEFIKSSKNKELNINEFNKTNKDEYLKEIAKQIEEELTPQTVDLTEYEKAEEEHAIISYQELLSLKEKTNNEDKKEKTFLEDLKTLRNLLDQNT